MEETSSALVGPGPALALWPWQGPQVQGQAVDVARRGTGVRASSQPSWPESLVNIGSGSWLVSDVAIIIATRMFL